MLAVSRPCALRFSAYYIMPVASVWKEKHNSIQHETETPSGT
jgi:hypothetical protein